MVANASANRREGISFPDDIYGFFVITLTDESHIRWNIDPRRTGVLAWRQDQCLTYSGRAPLPEDVGFEFFPKVRKGGQHRIRTGLSERTEAGALDQATDSFQPFEIFQRAHPPGNLCQNLEHLLAADAAWGALTT
jgi:hypothetical protein